jgi:hypothetical protein
MPGYSGEDTCKVDLDLQVDLKTGIDQLDSPDRGPMQSS